MSAGVIKLVFVNRNYVWYGKLISDIEAIAGKDGSQFDHVAIIIGDWLYEAEPPLLQKHHDIHKYDSQPVAFKNVNVPNIEDALAFAESKVGTPYGLLTSCVLGGIHDLTGLSIDLGDYDFSMDCSEYAAQIIRAGGLNIDPSVPDACITPRELYVNL
jgi:hypothetical protein